MNHFEMKSHIAAVAKQRAASGVGVTTPPMHERINRGQAASLCRTGLPLAIGDNRPAAQRLATRAGTSQVSNGSEGEKS